MAHTRLQTNVDRFEGAATSTSREVEIFRLCEEVHNLVAHLAERCRFLEPWP